MGRHNFLHPDSGSRCWESHRTVLLEGEQSNSGLPHNSSHILSPAQHWQRLQGSAHFQSPELWVSTEAWFVLTLQGRPPKLILSHRNYNAYVAKSNCSFPDFITCDLPATFDVVLYLVLPVSSLGSQDIWFPFTTPATLSDSFNGSFLSPCF